MSEGSGSGGSSVTKLSPRLLEQTPAGLAVKEWGGFQVSVFENAEKSMSYRKNGASLPGGPSPGLNKRKGFRCPRGSSVKRLPSAQVMIPGCPASGSLLSGESAPSSPSTLPPCSRTHILFKINKICNNNKTKKPGNLT